MEIEEEIKKDFKVNIHNLNENFVFDKSMFLRGVVTHVFTLSSFADDKLEKIFPGFKEVSIYSRVSIKEDHNQSSATLDIFFFNNWAQKGELFKKDDIIKLKGESLLLYKNCNENYASSSYFMVVCDQTDETKKNDICVTLNYSYKANKNGDKSSQVAYLDDIFEISSNTEWNLVKRWFAKAAETVKNIKHYLYTRLSDLKAGPQESANLYCVVLASSFGRESNGKSQDLYWDLKVIDQSLHTETKGITLRVFRPNSERNLVFRNVGDVLRIHRADIQWLIKSSTPELNIVCSAKFSSLIKYDVHTKEYVTTHNTNTYNNADAPHFENLSNWALQILDQTKDFFLSNFYKTLAHARQYPGNTFDTMVCLVSIYRKDGHLELIVWDGTGDQDPNFVIPPSITSLSSTDKPLLGILQKVSVADNIREKFFALKLQPSNWVLIRGMVSFGGNFSLNENSGVLFIPETCRIVEDTNIAYDLRREQHVAATSLSFENNNVGFQSAGRIASIGVGAIEFTTALRSSLAKIKSFDQVPYKFRACVQVVSVTPSNYSKITKYKTDTKTFEYQFQLTLKEDDVTLKAFLVGKEAERFFFGIPPTNLLTDKKSRDMVTKRLEKILTKGILIDVCLFSYLPQTYLDSKEGKEFHSPDDVRYHIFGTTIL